MAKKEKKETKTPESWAQEVKDKFQEVKDFRAPRVEKQWMINHAWYRGWHNLKYNTQTKRLVWDERDPLRFFINIIYAVVRAIRANVTKYQPKWEVDGLPYGSLSVDEGRALGYFLESQYEELGIKKAVKNVVMYGLLYGHGIFQYGYDEDLDDGEGNVWVDTPDPFDVYFDHLAGDVDNCRFVIKATRKPLSEIQKNPKYHGTEEIKTDSKLSASEYKSYLMQQDFGSDDTVQSKDSVLLYEGWFMEDDGFVRVVTVPENGDVPIRNEKTDMTRLPFILYFADINPGEIYSEGWVKNLVPLNRALNYVERNNLENIVLFAKGKYITDKGSNVKMVTNENGQIIRVSRGSRFDQMDMKPMPQSVFTFVQNLMRYIEDVGAVHEAFMGRTPAGIKAGVAIEQLISSNMNNLADLVDNLEMSLGQLGEELLRLGFLKFDTSKSFKVRKPGGEEMVYKVIGNGDVELEDAIKIPERASVKVNVVSGIAHTKEARKEILLQLRAGGDIDRRTLLEALDVPDVDEVEARLVEERSGIPISEDATDEMERKMMEAESQQASPEAPVAPPMGGPMPPEMNGMPPGV